MSEIIERLTRLSELAERLVAEKKDQEARIRKLEDQVRELKNDKQRLGDTLQEKENFIHILQTAKSLNTEEEKEEARNKVDDIVREIEHCLKLLDS